MSLKEVLLHELQAQRRHVIRTVTGVPSSALTVPVTPTSWAPAAALHHLALDVERWWFQAVIGNTAAAWQYFDDNPNGAWTVPEGVDVFELYAAESAQSDIIIQSRALDSVPDPWPAFMGRAMSLAEIVVHVIGETAAHAGQLDIVRETIDGHQNLVMD